ncbi:MAG TPA: hypothetical protein VK171_14530, partial [Fimbriimonas sp.]|nr:hypothetical protein [Fimbriimonas sp.]
MRGRLGVLLVMVSPMAFSQNPNRELQHYTMLYKGNSQLILGSSDARQGGGFSIGVGRVDPAFRI